MSALQQKSFFTMILPRKVKNGDRIQIALRLHDKPKIFRMVLGVKCTQDRRSNLEPTMIAFELKATFDSNKIAQVSSNWKTDEGWQNETSIEDSDWIDSRGLINLTLAFEGDTVNLFDTTNSLITKFDLNYELSKINRLQLWGDIMKLKTISLKYDAKNNIRSSQN